jgi:uncharacterized protein YcbK (DUF882 family)
MEMSNWTRRQWIQAAIAGGVGATLSRLAFAEGNVVGQTPPFERTLELFNTHTGETVSVIYRRGADYDTAGLAKLNHLMRDHRNGEAHDIDVGLYDQLSDLAIAADRDARYDIISGYRSPESNAKMAAASSGVAKKSLHMQGRAIDVRLHRCSCANLRDLALASARGGVGYYQRSDFVHLDTGRFRTWAG